MEKRKVYLWGFKSRELDHWPPDLEPVIVTNVPLEDPVVVPSEAAEYFQEVAVTHPRPNGRLPEAILYLRHGQRVPAAVRVYFDATVQEGDWAALHALLECPRQFTSAEMAYELPVVVLETLEDPVDAVVTEFLPLPSEAREHLGICHICRSAFSHTLKNRQETRQCFVEPRSAELTSCVRGISQAPQTASQQQKTLPVWLTIPLRPARERLVHATDRVREALAIFLESLHAQLEPGGALTRFRELRGESGRIGSFLEQLEAGRSLRAYTIHQDLEVEAWDRDTETIYIGNLHGIGKDKIEDFRVRIRRGSEIIWEAASVRGRVKVSAEFLAQVLMEGAVEFIFALDGE